MDEQRDISIVRSFYTFCSKEILERDLGSFHKPLSVWGS
jgi:hypothetical protein